MKFLILFFILTGCVETTVEVKYNGPNQSANVLKRCIHTSECPSGETCSNGYCGRTTKDPDYKY